MVDPGNEPDAASCTLRDGVQAEVWKLVAENIAQIQANGGLFWAYSDRADRGHWGAVRLDGTSKPVHDDFEMLMDTLESSRDLSPLPLGCLEVKPYSQPNFYASLMESYDDYLSLATDGDSHGHVDVRLLGECVGE